MVHSLCRQFFTKLNTFLAFDPVILYYSVYPKDLNIFVQTKPACRFLLQQFFFQIFSKLFKFEVLPVIFLLARAECLTEKQFMVERVCFVVRFEGMTHCGRTSRGGMTGSPHMLGATGRIHHSAGFLLFPFSFGLRSPPTGMVPTLRPCPLFFS